MCVFQEKLFVVTRLRNSIVSININSNWLQENAESPNKLISILLNEVKGTTRNEHNNFVTRKSSFQSFVRWPWSVYMLIRIYTDWYKACSLSKKNKVKRKIREWQEQGSCNRRTVFIVIHIWKKYYTCPSVARSLCSYCLLHLSWWWCLLLLSSQFH